MSPLRQPALVWRIISAARTQFAAAQAACSGALESVCALMVLAQAFMKAIARSALAWSLETAHMSALA